jgi:hypothetical protein
MKSGYYFCDRCEENAFGAICRICSRPARWVRPTVTAWRRRPKRAQPNAAFTVLFAQMRARVVAAPH